MSGFCAESRRGARSLVVTQTSVCALFSTPSANQNHTGFYETAGYSQVVFEADGRTLAEESSSGFYPHSGEQWFARCTGVSDTDEWCCNLKSGLAGQACERSHRTRDEPSILPWMGKEVSSTCRGVLSLDLRAGWFLFFPYQEFLFFSFYGLELGTARRGGKGR